MKWLLVASLSWWGWVGPLHAQPSRGEAPETKLARLLPSPLVDEQAEFALAADLRAAWLAATAESAGPAGLLVAPGGCQCRKLPAWPPLRSRPLSSW